MPARRTSHPGFGNLSTGEQGEVKIRLYDRRKFLYIGIRSVPKGWLGINTMALIWRIVCLAGSKGGDYAATIDRLPGGPPLAHWRLGEANGTSQIFDRKAGARHGTYLGTVGYGAAGLPQTSDSAIDFGATGAGAAPHDAGLLHSEFSLSFWFLLNTLPSVEEAYVYPLVTKDQTGLFVGDFAIFVESDGTLKLQFQDASHAYQLFRPGIAINTPYHLCVRADGTGFDAYLDGQYVGKSTGFTDAWSSNSQPIRFADVTWNGGRLADAILDEVALYPRVLTEPEVLQLAQLTGSPSATSGSFVVPESTTTVLDVVANDTYVGQKANLTVEIVLQGAHGTATVRSDNDIDFAANAVSQDEADSFTYKITDPNGTSNVATAGVTVQKVGSAGGGTLVYSWAPDASWIDGVPLTSRDTNDVLNSTFWVDGASVGGALVKAVTAGGNNKVCWNRAPDGSPSLEMASNPAVNGVSNIYVQLYDIFNTDPRHLRVVMEIKTSKSTDFTTYKANGVGTTSGSYTNFSDSILNPDHPGKYFVGLYAGLSPSGACATNWWNNASYPRDRAGYRVTWTPSPANLKSYIYAYDRDTQCGEQVAASPQVDCLSSGGGLHGVWHRLEIEILLTDPATVPANAEGTVEPDHTGDGVAKIYLTKDIDGELGPPGTRQQIITHPGHIFFSLENNRYITANLAGFWINLLHGGSQKPNIEAWSWIRKIEVYEH